MLKKTACLSVAASLFWLPATIAAQQPGAQPIVKSSSQIVSGSVYATHFLTGAQASDSMTLKLLVLWRGSPGWPMRGERSGSSGGGTFEQYHQDLEYGGLTLSWAYDAKADSANILGKALPLRGANVVLVDSVDAPAGHQTFTLLTLSGRLYVHPDTTIRSSGTGSPPMTDVRRDVDVFQLLRRSPEIANFLRCESSPAVTQMLSMFDFLCAKAIPAPILSVDSITVVSTRPNAPGYTLHLKRNGSYVYEVPAAAKISRTIPDSINTQLFATADRVDPRLFMGNIVPPSMFCGMGTELPSASYRFVLFKGRVIMMFTDSHECLFPPEATRNNPNFVPITDLRNLEARIDKLVMTSGGNQH